MFDDYKSCDLRRRSQVLLIDEVINVSNQEAFAT